MQSLEQFEDLVERLLEGSFARLFRSPVHPVELARKLERSLEAGKRVGVSGLIAPNHYSVRLNHVDYGKLSPSVRGLERELAQLMSTLAAKRNYALTSYVVVGIGPDPSLPRQAVRVESSISDHLAPEKTDSEEENWEGTVMLPIQRVTQHPGPPVSMVFNEGAEAGRVYPLDRRLVTIGRSLENNIVIEDERVSRHHAQLRLVGTQFYVLDLGSTNGTFVNGRRVREQVIGEGDEISFGGVASVYTAAPRGAYHGKQGRSQAS